MKDITLIAAVDKNWGIGYHNELLFHLKKDMAFFREKTLGNTVIMGRKTLESFPGGKPLPERTNIVLTSQTAEDFTQGHPGDGTLVVCHSVAEVMRYLEGVAGDSYVIGGGMVYRQFVEYASRALITQVDRIKEADTFFPRLDDRKDWEVAREIGTFCEAGVAGRFVEYVRKEGICLDNR